MVHISNHRLQLSAAQYYTPGLQAHGSEDLWAAAPVIDPPLFSFYSAGDESERSPEQVAGQVYQYL